MAVIAAMAVVSPLAIRLFQADERIHCFQKQETAPEIFSEAILLHFRKTRYVRRLGCTADADVLFIEAGTPFREGLSLRLHGLAPFSLDFMSFQHLIINKNNARTYDILVTF